jgi:VWFA-related protein
LDVVVTDATGAPVTGLEPWDFSLLDNGKPQKILTFHAFNGTIVKPNPPVEVILLVDTANLQFQQVAFVRPQIEAFLREKGGHLEEPVTIMLLSDAGLRIQPHPSVDGEAEAAVVHHIDGGIGAINPAMGEGGLLERFQRSVHQMAAIAENEAKKPRRKLLIWVSSGWPMFDSANWTYSEREKQRYFATIVELSTKLREARTSVWSVSPLDSTMGNAVSTGTSFSMDTIQMRTVVHGATRGLRYQDFLKGVPTARQAETGNLALQVLALQSGGLIEGPDNDLTGQIDRCVADASTFYRISFDPPKALRADEYHELKLAVDKPGFTVRTNKGYYNEP